MPIIGDFYLKIQHDAYVSDLKEAIRQKRQIPCDKQMLTFNGLVLEESYKIEAYGICDGSVVPLSLPMELPVNLSIDIRLPSGTLANLKSTHKDTVHSLKRQLQRLHGLPLQSYELIFQDVLLNGDQTLAACGLIDRCTLDVVLHVPSKDVDKTHSFSVVVKSLAGYYEEIEINQSATAGDLKKAIETEEGIPTEDMRLLFKGKPLEDRKYLNEYQIQQGSTTYSFRVQTYLGLTGYSSSYQFHNPELQYHIGPSVRVSYLPVCVRLRRLALIRRQTTDVEFKYMPQLGTIEQPESPRGPLGLASEALSVFVEIGAYPAEADLLDYSTSDPAFGNIPQEAIVCCICQME
ncbi:unnamed protein product [Dibothriocephalus latus]|uniref:Ubiquitin-like domain-containing protein n=1 Tax=Dibothriocephalus latus TaxID=60516 RepID=A0A3P7LIQ6_DIBLA|nr:unnamed protein product [Dibothriocephalus latus]